MTEMFRRISRPFAGSGTKNMLARWCGGASGFVTAMQIAKPAPSIALANHFRPLMTQSLPSFTAVVDMMTGFEPALFGSVIVKQLRISPRTSGSRNCSFCFSLACACIISMLPASGAWELNAMRPSGLLPISSITRPNFKKWRPPPPTSFGIWSALRPSFLVFARSLSTSGFTFV